MDDTLVVEVRRRLREFRDWSERLTLSGYRLATAYPEIENLHVYEISRTEAEDRIEGYLCEGFFVDWAEHDGYLYLLFGRTRTRTRHGATCLRLDPLGTSGIRGILSSARALRAERHRADRRAGVCR